MKLKDEAAWQKWVVANHDPYGGACVAYAKQWAEAMEKEMAEGAKLEDIAKRTSHEANTEGITGFMYGAAVSMLAGCWEHGEALRVWHNLDTQIKIEGEKANESGSVLNPAILSMSVEEGA